VKQMLLRVPNQVHQRLAARASREGRSVNALATEILDLGADVDQGDRRSRLRATAAAAGMLRAASAVTLSAGRRRRAIDSARGLGPVADVLLRSDRDRI
jgi:plasmid stability protein